MRFPHRTRDIGSVPLVGHGRVGWEPELTPHNSCLAVAVPPVTQSNSESDSREEMERNRASMEWRGEKPCKVPYLVTQRIYKHTFIVINTSAQWYAVCILYIKTKDRKTHSCGEQCTCLALDLLIVSEIGFFFSLTALLENRSTNSSKSTAGSSIFSHTSELLLLNTERKIFRLFKVKHLNLLCCVWNCIASQHNRTFWSIKHSLTFRIQSNVFSLRVNLLL